MTDSFIITVHSSIWQLTLIQTQKGIRRPVAYASRTLTDVERRYSQAEKEALGLVWACERFHHYIFGMSFELLTDHKPLEVIYSPRAKPSAQIERWVLRLQPYDFSVRDVQGKNNIAESLSRLPVRDTPRSDPTEDYVRQVVQAATPNALKLGTSQQPPGRTRSWRPSATVYCRATGMQPCQPSDRSAPSWQKSTASSCGEPEWSSPRAYDNKCWP